MYTCVVVTNICFGRFHHPSHKQDESQLTNKLDHSHGLRLPFLRRKDCSRRCERVMFCILAAMILVWTQGTSAGEIPPNLATVETWSDTQIKVTWQPPSEDVAHYPVTSYYYELYIDEHLEYFGNDVMYVARRLTPDTMYYFKLRRCVENTDKCTQFSKILAGTTAQSQKRGFTKSFLQWMIICVLVTGLACTTAVIGVKISRKLWRSFLYKYDYTSQSVVRLPKYLDTTGDLDEVEPMPLCVNNPKEKLDQRRITSMCHVSFQKEKHTKEQKIQENKLPLIFKEGGESNNADSEQGSTTEKICSENFKNGEIPNQNDFDESSDFLTQITQKTENVSPGNCKNPIFELNLSSPRVNHTVHIPEENKQKWSDDRLRAQKDNEKHHVVRLEHISLRTPPTATRGEPRDIVVAVDNSNIFIGAKECASALNPKERKRNIRVKIQQLVKVLERGRTLSRAFVQGSSPPSSEQVWEVYRRLGYCVDLEDRRGKDEQRVDEGLHLHIYKALCELSPRKLVIASGDGNKGKSEGATSLPGCAQAALEKGWLVEVHAWQHSLSMEWLKLSRKYPELVSIHHLDRYINHITFVDGKYGRRCQTFPTDFFKRIS